MQGQVYLLKKTEEINCKTLSRAFQNYIFSLYIHYLHLQKSSYNLTWNLSTKNNAQASSAV